jgi:hypothetical protein
VKTGVEQLSDATRVPLLLEPVANDVNVFIYLLFGIELLDDLDVVGIRGFEMNLAFERFLYHKAKMRTLGAIAIKVFALVLMFFKGGREHRFSLFDLHADLGQIRELKGGTMLRDEFL